MNKLKLGIYAIVASLVLWGCDDLLDVNPSTSLPGEEVVSSGEGVEALRESMYSQIRASFSYTTGYFIGPSSFADELRLRPGATRYQTENNAVDGDGGRTHITGWSATYDIIQDLNLMIGAVDTDEIETLDEATLEQYRGEAYALRAFTYHHLVRGFGYEPGNYDQGPEGNWDLGVILHTDPVLELEDVEQVPRNTVDEIYEQIFSDLDAAKERLQGVTTQTRVNEAFVDGLRARVNLYAGNWQEAADAADEAIANSGRELVTDADAMDDMFVEGGLVDVETGEVEPRNDGLHQETMFLLVVNPDTENQTGDDTFTNNGPAGYTSDQWGAQLPTQFVLDHYEEDDIRLYGWYEPCFDYTDGEQFANCDGVNDEGYTITKFNGAKGNDVDDMPYMRLAEMYLIKAEGQAKAGDLDGGLTTLNELREARNASEKDAGNQEEFEDLVLRERVRELVAEGHRFYDLKRLGRHVTNPDGSTKFRADSHRILSPIPLGELGVNEELVDNPGFTD